MMCGNCDRERKADLADIVQRGLGGGGCADRQFEIQMLGLREPDGSPASVVSVGGSVPTETGMTACYRSTRRPQNFSIASKSEVVVQEVVTMLDAVCSDEEISHFAHGEAKRPH